MKPSLRLLPVRFSIYQAISELNRSFEECAERIEHLVSFNIFRADNLRAYHVMIEEIRALANQELTEVLNARELQNSAYYERLRLKRERHLEQNKTKFPLRESRSARQQRKAAVHS